MTVEPRAMVRTWIRESAEIAGQPRIPESQLSSVSTALSGTLTHNSRTSKSISWNRVFEAPAGSINLPDQQNCHDHWKIPCEALPEKVEKCTHVPK
jgi:hypothetical protein